MKKVKGGKDGRNEEEMKRLHGEISLVNSQRGRVTEGGRSWSLGTAGGAETTLSQTLPETNRAYLFNLHRRQVDKCVTAGWNVELPGQLVKRHF